MPTAPAFPPLLQAYCTERLRHQRHARPHTMARSRTTFGLLRPFAQQQVHKAPSRLRLAALDAPLLSALLAPLAQARGNSASSRHARLAALHAFCHDAALSAPQYRALLHRVLALPSKRTAHTAMAWLTRPEIDALFAAPSQAPWTGRRERTFWLIAVPTGRRVSARTGWRCPDVVRSTGAHVHGSGKGRKARCPPLRQEAVAACRLWLRARPGGPVDAVLPKARGGALSRDGVAYLLATHVATARQHGLSLQHQRVSPHVLRHPAAMELLRHGVDRAVLALWLGHASVETPHRSLHASLALKEPALAKTTPCEVPLGRYRPADQRLAFLKGLS